MSLKFPRFVLTYPGSLQGGLMLFGIVMIIGIVSLYFFKKAYQAKIVREGLKHEQAQYDSASRVCRSYGGSWEDGCCNRPKQRLPSGVPKCSR